MGAVDATRLRPGGRVVSRYEASIEERGNGFADVGDYVVGDDDKVYRVVTEGSDIETQSCGAGNICHGYIVEDADWDDIDDSNEPVCSALLGKVLP